MPAKSKTSYVKVPTAWLIAGALILGTAGVAMAMKGAAQKAAIDEVKFAAENQPASVKEGTFTGVVSREATNAKEKERYVLTTSAGSKYILIGLKKEYVDKGKSDDAGKPENTGKPDDTGKPEDKAKGRPTAKPTPKTSPKADSEDVNSFEQYLGKKVTIVGMVVPVDNELDNSNKTLKDDNPRIPEMSPKGKKPSSTPRVYPSPKASPQGGDFFDRLVVKSIKVVQ